MDGNLYMSFNIENQKECENNMLADIYIYIKENDCTEEEAYNEIKKYY